MGGRLPRGYTIVEVMLFVAISGAMFVVAASYIDGRQGKAEFKQSMNNTVTEIRDVINDVANGSYTTNDGIICNAPSFGAISITSGARTQGQNKGCVFLGKVMQFGTEPDPDFDNNRVSIYTVAGRQYAGGSTSTLATAFGFGGNDAVRQVVVPGFIEEKRLQFGSSVRTVQDASRNTSGASISASGCLPTDAGAIGFFGGFGNYVGATLQSGAQSVIVTCVPGIGLNANRTIAEIGIGSISNTSVHSTTDYKLCFNSGKGERASITIGGASNQQLGVKLKMGDTTCPA